MSITDLGREHPITAGIDDFDLVTEQYWVLHDDLIDVLATTTHPTQAWHPWHRPVTSPAIWTRQWGAGPDRRDDPGPQPRRAGAPERPHRHREGHAVGEPHRVGVVGLGVISRAYLDTLAGHPEVERRRGGRPRRRPVGRGRRHDARRRGAERRATCSPTRTCETVLNLTIPAAHAEIALGAIDGGQARVRREAARRRRSPDGRAIIERGRRGRRPGRLRAGHRAGHGYPDGAGGDRRRADRTPAVRVGRHGHARARALAPQPRLLLRARAAARCWTWGRTTSRRWSTCSARCAR